MSKRFQGLTFYLDVLEKLEILQIPYVIIGGFAAVMYGTNRATLDIDMVVHMEERHIQALAAAYPSPRYYADPNQMQRAIQLGSSFNIIDSTLGEKADLFPLSMDLRYKPAFDNRIRRTIEKEAGQPFDVWAARPEDVIVGKLMAWEEGGSNRHTNDIYEMMVFYYLGGEPEITFDEARVAAAAEQISTEAFDMWQLLNEAAKETAKTDQNR